MSEIATEAADADAGNGDLTGPALATAHAAVRAALVRKPHGDAAGSGRRAPGRKSAGRVSPGILRAVKVSLAVAAAAPDVRDALAALAGADPTDAEDIAVAIAADAAGDPRMLIDVLSLPAASPGEGMRVAISVASATRDAQRELWAALARLGFASGKASPNPEELALAIVHAGQGIPEYASPALRSALGVLAAGRES